jgi:pyridinium-3,5-biscarboxylic acid mononucleotide sulfurtransferase
MRTDDEDEKIRASSIERLSAVRDSLRSFESALVAFSGGVDSAFLLKLAIDELGAKAVALTAVSASVPQAEIEQARAFTAQLGAQHVIVKSNELADARYAANPTNRCYFCKTELYSLSESKRVELGLGIVLDGFNADDQKDHRPGHQAAREHRVESPLKHLSKAEIRAWSKHFNLPTWNKPQTPCLASRIPYGTQVTVERLKQIEVAEASLRQLGLKNFRVRFHDSLARIEVSSDEFEKFNHVAFRREALDVVKRSGFKFAVLDLEPFRSGRLNDSVVSKALNHLEQ